MNVAIAGEEVQPGGSQGRRFVYGGVEFDMLGESASGESDCHFTGDVPSFASVVCDVHGTPEDAEPSPLAKQVVATWSNEGALVEGRGVHARLRQMGDRRFVATVARRTAAISRHPVEEALAFALVERCGGVVLHAAAISLETNGTVLFIGPSGAGKTTACNLTGRPFFARDKLALVPRGNGEWWAWPLAGGTLPERAELAGQPALPVVAICRVRQGSGETRAEELSSHRAVFLVRESCFASTSVGEDEQRLQSIVRLCSSVTVLELDTVLGSNPLCALRAWLS